MPVAKTFPYLVLQLNATVQPAFSAPKLQVWLDLELDFASGQPRTKESLDTVYKAC